MAETNSTAEKTNNTLSAFFVLFLGILAYIMLQETIFFVVLPCLLGISLLFFDYYTRKLIKFVYFVAGVFLGAVCFIFELPKTNYFIYHKQLFGLDNYQNALHNIVALYHKVDLLTFCNVLLLPTFVYGFVGFAFIVFCLFLAIPKTASQRLADANRKPREVKADFKKLEKINGGWAYGVPLGVTLWYKSEPVIVPFNALNKHTCLVGTTGSGKTVTLFNFIVSAMVNHKALIFIDGKGALENITKFTRACEEFNKKCHVITIDGKDGYNPFASGTPSELTDKIISMFDWTEEHYKLTSSRFLQLLIQYLQLKKIPVTLSNIILYSDIKKLTELEIQDLRRVQPNRSSENIQPSFDDLPSFDEPTAAEAVPVATAEAAANAEATKASMLFDKIKSIEIKSIQGLQARIASLAEGDMEELFSNPDALNLAEAIEQKEAVLFSIDSLRYAEQSKALGRLVVNDIKTCVSHHAKNGAEPVGLFFDEFNVFASHEVIDIINKSRSAGFEAVLAFQSLSDIDKLNNGEALRRQIIQNCNNLIVQKQNDSKDAEELSKIFGTYETQELTVQEQKNGEAGAGSLRMVNKFRVAPDDIKRLQTGEAFVKIGNGIRKIKVQDLYSIV